MEWLLAAVAALVCFALPVLVMSSPGNQPGATPLWPMPGLILLEIALLPAVLFGLAAALASRRLGRGWREGLSTLVLSAGVNAMLVAVLISLPKGA